MSPAQLHQSMDLKDAELALGRNDLLYRALCGQIERHTGRDPESIVNSVELAAGLAAYFHNGRFADGFLENLLLDLAETVPALPAPAQLAHPSDGRKLNLHVATKVYSYGGHTRCLAKWVQKDQSSAHAVVLTNQTEPLPSLLVESCQSVDATMVVLDTAKSHLERAGELRSLAALADRVILHHHPEDSIPLLALAHGITIPAALFNHAHFCFGLGGAVADLYLNTLPYYGGITKKFRYPRATALISFGGISDSAESGYSVSPGSQEKREAKVAVGLSASQTVILTTGAASYYRPGLGYNFFSTLETILRDAPGVQVAVVGPDGGEDFIPPSFASHPQVRFFGTVKDPFPFYRAADIALESFPMPSLGAFLDAVRHGGAYPIPVYGPGESILRTEYSWKPDLTRARDEADYIRAVLDCVNNSEHYRIVASQLQQSLFDTELSGAGMCNFAEVNRILDQLEHKAERIPRSPMSQDADSLALAWLHPIDLGETLHHKFGFWRATFTGLTACVQGLIDTQPFLKRTWDIGRGNIKWMRYELMLRARRKAKALLPFTSR